MKALSLPASSGLTLHSATVPPDRATSTPQHASGEAPVIAAIGLVVGVIPGLMLHPDVPLWLQPYLPIAVVAALDAVFGGVRAILDGIFDDKVFVVSFCPTSSWPR